MSFDEQPDGPIHGECEAEIKRLTDELSRREKQIEVATTALAPTENMQKIAAYSDWAYNAIQNALAALSQPADTQAPTTEQSSDVEPATCNCICECRCLAKPVSVTATSRQGGNT